MKIEELENIGITSFEDNMNYWMNEALKYSKNYVEFKDEFYLERTVSSILYAEEWLSEMLNKGMITGHDYSTVHGTLSSAIVRICKS